MMVDNLAMWDGSTWQDVGGGVTHTNTSWQKIYSLAVDGDDNLYVGGIFDHAGAVAASNLAVWNGSAWSAVGGGVNGAVMSIEMVSGGMYVGGLFTRVGSLDASNIAYRDFQTSSWSTLGSGVDDTVYAIEVEPDTGSVFVGGDFAAAGGAAALRIARYYGENWYTVGDGLTGGGQVNTLLRVPKDGGGYYIYVGGEFGQVGTTVYADNIARWDGAAWSALGDGAGGEVKALAYTPGGDLIVAGDFSSIGSGVAANNIASWDDASWSAMGGGLGIYDFEQVNALALSGAVIQAGGRFDLAGDLVVSSLARWDGSDWAALDGGLGLNNYPAVLMADGDSVYAAGSITQFGSLQAEGLARLGAGFTWSGDASPAAVFIRALVKSGATNLYAGGAFDTIGGAAAGYLAWWNGAAWQELAGGTNGYVNALALNADGDLFVGGEFTQVGGTVSASHIAMWDGAWHPVGDGLDGTVRELAIDADGNLYAAGEFLYAGSLYVNHIAMWDGASWSALGSGLDHQYVESLIFDDDGRLYAGGYFAHAGGLPANGVAMWNGYAWSALGNGMDNGVGALAVDSDGYLYAGGDFDTAGLVAASHIARWDGFAWSALGSGADNNVYELAIPSPGTFMVVGGLFNVAGGKPSSKISLYDFPLPDSAPAPTLTGLDPEEIAPGGPEFLLNVNGVNFSSRSVIYWNGSPLNTTFRNRGLLFAAVPAGLTAGPGSVSIHVYTPAPAGGGSSFTKTFTILEDYSSYLPLLRR